MSKPEAMKNISLVTLFESDDPDFRKKLFVQNEEHYANLFLPEYLNQQNSKLIEKAI